MSLRVRLALAFVLVVLVPLLVGVGLAGRVLPRSLDQQDHDALMTARNALTLALSQFCDQSRAVGLSVATAAAGAAPQVDDRAGQQAVRRAGRQAVEHGLADFVTVMGGAGQVIVTTGRSPVDAGTLGNCAAGERTSPGLVVAQVAVRSAAGSRVGTVVAGVALGPRRLTELSAAAEADVTVLDHGEIVASTLDPGLAARMADAAAGAFESPRRVGDRLVLSADAIEGRPTVVLSSDVLPSAGGIDPVVVALVVVTVMLAATIGWQLARVTTRPLAELAAAATRIAAGDLRTRVPLRRRDEVGRLGEVFNEMAEELHAYITALEHNRDELRRTISRLGEMLTGTHDLNRMLGVILDTAMESVGAAAGGVWLVDPDRSHLTLTVQDGLRDRSVPADLSVPWGAGLVGGVAAGGDAVRGRPGSGPGRMHMAATEPPAHTVVAVPFVVGGRPFGVLALFDRLDSGEFGVDDEDALRAFAGQASVALDNVLLHQEAERLSFTDPLTDAWNYRYLQMTLSKEIERAVRFDRPLSVALLDLDLFKAVNDTYGHQRGDRVLVELAARVHAQIREVDTLARYGGEEFVLVLPETELAGALRLAERVTAAIRDRPFGEREEPLRVTVSMGVATFPRHASSAQDLLYAADSALYAAKDAGRDRVRTPSEPDLAIDLSSGVENAPASGSDVGSKPGAVSSAVSGAASGAASGGLDG